MGESAPRCPLATRQKLHIDDILVRRVPTHAAAHGVNSYHDAAKVTSPQADARSTWPVCGRPAAFSGRRAVPWPLEQALPRGAALPARQRR